MSWVYYFSLFIIILALLISTIRYILKKKHNNLEKIILISSICFVELFLTLIISFFLFLFINVPNDNVIIVGNEKYVESTDFFEIHPKPKYYEYKKFLIRKIKEVKMLEL